MLIESLMRRATMLFLPVLLLAAVGAKAKADAGVADLADPEVLAELMNEAINLRASVVQTIEIDATPGQPFVAVVPVGGEVYTADLTPKSVRAPGFQLRAQIADGSFVDVEPATVRTLRGTLQEVEGAVLAGSLLDDGLFMLVQFSEGDRYWIEPVARYIDGVAADQYVVYNEQDVIASGGFCTQVANPNFAPGNLGGDGGVAGLGIYTAELAVDADVEYFQDYGSINGTENQIESVINTMNVQYETEVDITHLITTIIVRTSEPDPYPSTNPNSLLDDVRDEWQTNLSGIPRDVVQLFTGKDIQGSVLGIAWVGSICTNLQYSVVESNCCFNFACKTDLSAHELGHNWGANHCNCPSNTMNAGLTCTNNFHDTNTVPEVVAFRNSVEDCLTLGNPLLRIIIDGPEEVEEGQSAQYTSTAQFLLGDMFDVTSETIWSVIPPTAGTITQNGLFTAAANAGGEEVIIHGEYTSQDGDFDPDDFEVTIIDGPPQLGVDVILETSADLGNLCPGQSITIDFLAVATEVGDINDVRLLQYDTSESVGITVDSFAWDLQELISPGMYFIDNTPPVVNASYTGLSGVPGLIVNLTQTPQVVGHMNVTFEGGAGSLSVCGPEMPPSSDFGVRYFAGFTELLEFTLPLGNINCIAIPLSEGTGDCDDISLVASDPPTDAIDARQPSNLDGSNVAGFDSIDLMFSGDPSSLTPGDFTLTEQGGDGIAPGVASVVVSDVNTVTLSFDSIIEVGAWTTVTFDATGESVRIGFLPADANGDGTSSAVDVLALIDSLNGVTPLPIYSTDIDRSGIPGAADVLRQIDLLNGAGVYPVFNGMSLPN